LVYNPATIGTKPDKGINEIGNWAVASVADLVFLFGVLQFYGIRKLQQERAG